MSLTESEKLPVNEIASVHARLMGSSSLFTKTNKCEKGVKNSNGNSKKRGDVSDDEKNNVKYKSSGKKELDMQTIQTEKSCSSQKSSETKQECDEASPTKQITLDMHHNEENANIKDEILDINSQPFNDHSISTSATFPESKTRQKHSTTTAVEVVVTGLQHCYQDAPRTAQSNKPSLDKTCQQSSDHGCGGHPLRTAQNLSKSPISLITLNTDYKRLTALEGNATDIGIQKDTLNLLTDESKGEFPLVSNTKTVATKDRSESGECISDIKCCQSDHPTVRRRLSKTIQHLQEKLQQEMENDENKCAKQNGDDGKPHESKKFPGAANVRCRRECSRKRSKSRIAFKVLQGARKYPPVHAKERPYRQWMGVGNCVTHDSRYIVSSTGIVLKQTKKLETSAAMGSAENSSESPASSSQVNCVSILTNSGNERNIDWIQQQKDKEEETLASQQISQVDDTLSNHGHFIRNQGSFSSIEANQTNRSNSVHGIEQLKNEEKQEISSTKNVPSEELPHEPHLSSMTAHLKTEKFSTPPANDEKPAGNDIFSKSTSPTRERSRCTKRAPIRRLPTPHSDYNCAALKNSNPSHGMSKTCPNTSKGLFLRKSNGSPNHTTSSRKGQSVKNYINHTCSSSNSKEQSSFARGMQKGRSPSKPKLSVYGPIRSTKMFTAAAKQQKKPLVQDHEFGKRGCTVKNDEIHCASFNTKQISPCEVDSMTSGDNIHHGSFETLWSDVSATTWESSIKTGSSSSWYRTDISGNHCDASLKDHIKSTSKTRGTGAESCERTDIYSLSNVNNQLRKYIDVKAIENFRGALPGQLSFCKGQMIKQFVSASPASADGMSYGYYRVGAFRRKKKGLFPSSCVISISK
ncbi:hypothetical protein PoB_004541600 [Plakobranchus ocellatus]|uniref:SH3 domain-containing protein n=1 Tax=Plakobranchus ocellatus TaxID=259542 RepID=A0AAV4B6A5_9GAST|nr:hypothetical protein PoB_004541600 [Plakobranchus ocellatus]